MLKIGAGVSERRYGGWQGNEVETHGLSDCGFRSPAAFNSSENGIILEAMEWKCDKFWIVEKDVQSVLVNELWANVAKSNALKIPGSVGGEMDSGSHSRCSQLDPLCVTDILSRGLTK